MGPSYSSSTATSTQRREEGNALYHSGKLKQAITKYTQAIHLDPKDPAPYRSLSSAKFELGDYKGCLATIIDALAIEDDEEKIQVLKLRRAKSFFYLKEFTEAKQALEGLDSPEAERERLAIDSYVQNHPDLNTEEVRKNALADLSQLPLYRPTLYDLQQYFPTGHDEALAALNDDELLQRRVHGHRPLDLAFFYGGTGDSRHFYQQIHHIYAYYKEWRHARVNTVDKFSIVLQDQKPHTIAQQIIVFRLLHQLNEAKDENEKIKILATVVYTWVCEIMPAYSSQILRDTIQSIIDCDKDNFDLHWLRCNKATLSAVKDVCRYWLSDELSEAFDVEYAQKHQYGMNTPDSDTWVNNFCRHYEFELRPEWEQLVTSAVVYPPTQILQDLEPELVELIAKNKSPSRETKEAIRDYARKEWKINPTCYQELEWYKRWGRRRVGSDPTETAWKMWAYMTSYGTQPVAEMKKPDIIQLLMPFFHSLMEAFYRIPNLEITVYCGIDDVFHQMDCIHLGFGDHNDLPKTYDTIYLGNIPDYTGGYLSTAIHCVNILKPITVSSGNSFVQTNTIVCATDFHGLFPQTLAEYALLPSLDVAKDMLGISRTLTPQQAEDDGDTSWANGKEHQLLMEPNRWIFSSPTSTALPTKGAFTRWLTHLFFKFSSPPKNPDRVLITTRQTGALDPVMWVNQPLTLSSFIRFSVYLVKQRQIPGHWIGAILDQMLTGSGTTSARPIDYSPLEVRDVRYMSRHPPAGKWEQETFNVSAFVPDLRSLLIRYLPLLPFALTTPLSSRQQLFEYSLNFDITDESVGPNTRVLALVFAQSREECTSFYDDFRKGGAEKGVYVIGNFSWKSNEEKKGVARWWMEEQFVEEMKTGGWKAWLVRLDIWSIMSEELEASAIVRV